MSLQSIHQKLKPEPTNTFNDRFNNGAEKDKTYKDAFRGNAYILRVFLTSAVSEDHKLRSEADLHVKLLQSCLSLHRCFILHSN